MKQLLVCLILLTLSPYLGVSQEDTVLKLERLLRESAYDEAEAIIAEHSKIKTSI